jgi:acetylornithine deacetylase/succinyl-diaminopimelate desuccinylase-like protein
MTASAPPGTDLSAAELRDRPAELLRRLIRFDTTNPPGAERECVAFCERLLREAGLETRLLARDPERPNLVARLRGAGTAPPLLLQGHVDVVTTAGQDWRRPPFAGEIADGCVWGRGALDMKGGVAMMLAAAMRAAAEPEPPPGDVIVCVVSDEEAGGGAGARFLVEEHPELFEGVRHAIGEFGGFSQEVAGRRFYPVMVAEKRQCHVRATVRGPGGHGALPMRGGTSARLGALLRTLDRRRLPVHVTPTVRLMVEAMAAELPAPAAAPLRALLRPRLTDRVLDVLGERGRTFDPILHNTVNATVVRAGDKLNVIPSEAVVELDGRILPGQDGDDLARELRALAGDGVEVEVVDCDPPAPGEPDMALFGTLAEILREADPDARPVPLLLAGVTDGRHFARLGIQTYGFLPMPLPPELDFPSLLHAADERIPVEAVEFGARAVREALRRFGAAG